jgi:hypothetical protein
LLYRTPPQFSWSTHYVGHLRAINNEILDAYQHKSLDALIQLNDKSGNKWTETLSRRKDGKLTYPAIEDRIGHAFDIVISAIGWKFDDGPFASSGNEVAPKMMVAGDTGDRYPELDATFQSVNVPGLYFAGSLAHGIDKGKSSGGFIHGFRYNVRALARILLSQQCQEERGEKCIEWPEEQLGCIGNGQRADLAASKMAKGMMDRIGSTSALYQMFDELQDLYVFQEGCLRRYEEVPKRHVPTLLDYILPKTEREERSDVAAFTVSLKYREGFSDSKRDVFDPDRVVIPNLPYDFAFAFESLPTGWDSLNFLHPVLETLRYSSSSCIKLLNVPFHMMEDIRTLWSRPLDLIPLVEWLLVRTFSDPCEFSQDADGKKILQTYWKLFVVAAGGALSGTNHATPNTQREDL